MSIKAIASISGIIGFAIGCSVMALMSTERHRDEKIRIHAAGAITASAPATPVQARAETADADITPNARDQAIFDDTAARRILNEVMRKKLAYVRVNFFEQGVKLTPEFLELFGVAPDKASQLNELLQDARTSMVNDLRSQAQVSRTEDGGIVVRFQPVDSGPDIYDKVMGGFQTILGDARFRDVITFGGRQIESRFNEFGGQVRTVTLHKTEGILNGEHFYEYKDATERGWRGGRLSLKDMIQYYPELDGLIPND